MPAEQKRNLIDQSSEVSISKQCHLLGVNRSTYYYKPLSWSRKTGQIN